MIKFLLKGILRDRSRSLLPIIVVSLGVFLTIVMSAWMKGIFTDMIDLNANFHTGHVKIMTRSYADNVNQMPLDLALLGIDSLEADLKNDYPDMNWVARINFGGLLDIPDENGETRAQGPAAGKALDFFHNPKEIERWNIRKSLVEGDLPKRAGDAIISYDFAQKFGLKIGQQVTLFGSTMYGSLLFKSFRVCGTIRFGMGILDRGALLIDISDAQEALNMEDGATEILGYFKDGQYDAEKAAGLVTAFNKKYSRADDEFSPQMFRLEEQSGLDKFLTLADAMVGMMISFFIIAMSIVLWNTGLLGGLRRYTEYGVRLALGEEKKHIYKTMIYEAVLIGIIGSVIGTILGLLMAYYLQEVGLDFSEYVKNLNMMMPPIYRAHIFPALFYIGFIPGLVAMVLGNALAGFAIYKRKTAQLFKELEV
jgi:putative ABC transport system permease protein